MTEGMLKEGRDVVLRGKSVEHGLQLQLHRRRRWCGIITSRGLREIRIVQTA
jgi:hypothetical protein